MARKKKEPPHENHERWLVSYADFITLLFAFFVVMFASSQTDKVKAQQVSDAVREAFEDGHFSSKVKSILGGAKDETGKGNNHQKGPGGQDPPSQTEPVADLLPSLERLKAELNEDVVEGKIELKMERRGLVVTLNEAAFFPSGEDTVMPEAQPTLARIAAVIRSIPNPLRLEGHTDSVPISTARFHNNWELSAARAIAIMLLFSEKYDVDQRRMAVTGYADTYPAAENDTPAGRARNRRVDVLVMSQVAMVGAPAQAPKGSAMPTAGHK